MTCPGRAEVLSISEDGDVFARVTASYDMLMTQRLILQPEVEINFAAETPAGTALLSLAS